MTTTAPTAVELRDALANAPEAPDASGDPGLRGPPNGWCSDPADQGGVPPDPDDSPPEIYDGCPVIPLGVRDKFTYFLDAQGQLRKVDNLNAETIKALFGRFIPSICHHFPQWQSVSVPGSDEKIQQRKPLHFNHQLAGVSMHMAASHCGVFNPDNSVRGVGAWTDDDGHLVYHMGDHILYQGALHSPGRLAGRIYPAAPPVPHPDHSVTAPDPVPPLMETLETWSWAQADLHPQIALGMIGVQMLGGALDWRPVFWMSAPAASGKSELQRLMKMLHGDDGLIQSTDATKSGITSQLGQSSLPVAIDELEPGDERSSKERDIINLARVAASGGQWFRGSSDQTGVGGKVYSAFLFSSILIPGVMKTQDVQRLVRLDLNPLKDSAPKLSLDPRTWRARGARLKALLIRRWPTWHDRLAAWRHALELASVTGRNADNWGTVLAMADMAMSDEIASPDTMANWARKVLFQVCADREDASNDAEAMLVHLMTQMFDPFRRGQQWTIAQWVMAAAGLPGAPAALLGSLGDTDMGYDARTGRMKAANAMLAGLGLRVSRDEQGADHLFLANMQLQALKDVFRNSDWANGVWKQSARRVPGATTPPNPLTLAGTRSRGTLMPLKSIPGLMSMPMDQDARAVRHSAADDLEDFA